MVDRNFQEDQTQGDRPPSEFGAVGAYNGFLALDPVGRIAVDSSFHHWTNLNLRGWPDWHRLGEAQKKENLTREEEQAFANIKKIRGYYTNLATWLAPWETQRLISVHAIASSIQRTPLEEALPDPPPHNLANYLRFGQLTIYHLLPLVAETHIRTWWIYFLEPGQAGSLLDEHNLRVDFHLEVLDECLLGAIVLWYWEYWWKDGRLPNVEDLIVVADEAIRSGWEHYKRAYITQTKKASEALIKRIDKLLYPTPGP
ncbi:hypothetical protein [Sulfidibacter corallicola]|uniref:Uncharacterized protein n=1 Tax=Sulfidibacter corallicola TaxID=2818388 RepID=A0A8A4TKW2_SULCO|nr:hypothetical protein [Sulfidibacter corallicola]QTD50596.1 hypothetical protein J3U87_33850 [Sulfidibacter corallicola]